jgi:predicted metal-dependent HD superfamily phosphohydrolase
MIKLFRIMSVGQTPPTNWVIGQFADKQRALDEYNSEVRRAYSERIDDGRPELEFIEGRREVEYFLAEEEVTHTAVNRDEAFETARWGLARKRATEPWHGQHRTVG